jgi:hypothetical protein
VGGRTVLTCFTPLERSRITSLAWIDASGEVIPATRNQVDLVFNPVTDDLSLQGAELTCRLVAGVTQTLSLRIVLLRKCEMGVYVQ